LLVIVICGLALGGFEISQSVAAIRDCDESCFDIEHAILGFEVKELNIPQNLTIVLLFVFHNPSSLSAYVVDLPFRVEVAGVDIGEGVLCCLPLLIPGNGNVEATGMIQLPITQIPSLALNTMKQYQSGVLDYAIRGTVTFRGVFLGVVVPFLPSITREFQKQGTITVLGLPPL